MTRIRRARTILLTLDHFEIETGWRQSIRKQRYPWAKRAFDLSVTLITAPVWLSLLVLILASVKATDVRNPALFRQWRTGRGGQRFVMLKVRTMTPSVRGAADAALDYDSVHGTQFKSVNDPRVTRLGRLLRRTHLDELPQLFNVLRGDMSLVGPRPNTPPIELYSDWWKARLQCRPGMTGLWQVRRSVRGEYDERARLDIEYLRRRSLALDARILFETVVVCLVRRSGV